MSLLSGLQNFCWKISLCLDGWGVPLYMTVFFLLTVKFNFVILIMICLGVGLILFEFFAALPEYLLLLQARQVFSHNLIDTFFYPPLSLSSLSLPRMWILLCMVFSLMSLKLSSLNIFFFCCFNWVIYNSLTSCLCILLYNLICSKFLLVYF